MPVDSTHSSYKNFHEEWQLLEDLCEGERKVKERGEVYLPRLSGQSDGEYTAYKKRGTLYNATDRTIAGMCGAIMRKDPEFSVGKKLGAILPSIMVDGRNSTELVRDIAHNILKTGRYGLLVDMSEVKTADNQPFIAPYRASDILNWRTTRYNGVELITFLVLRENIETIDEDDVFETKDIPQIRVLSLIGNEEIPEEERTFDNCICEIQLYRKVDDEWTLHGDPIYPTVGNTKLNRIPFVCIGSNKNGMDITKPPLLDLANINIAHWRQTVDHAHGLHFTALPTPWAAGFPIDRETKTLHIGSATAWVSTDPNASCGFLEFQGTGMAALVTDLDKKEKQMASLGANLIERKRSGIEAAETARIRQTTETVSLSTIVDCIANGLEKAFIICSMMLNESTDNIDAKINKDFIEYRTSPEMLKALTGSLQAGGMSSYAYSYNLKSGEMLPPDLTVEDELALIAADANSDFESNSDIVDDEEAA